MGTPLDPKYLLCSYMDPLGKTCFDALKLLQTRFRKTEILISSPRGSIYTAIRELGPKMAYYRRNHGSQFPNGCICGPSGSMH